jgi:hypothetical protein
MPDLTYRSRQRTNDPDANSARVGQSLRGVTRAAAASTSEEDPTPGPSEGYRTEHVRHHRESGVASGSSDPRRSHPAGPRSYSSARDDR